MNEDNDKFLPNFIVFICYILIALSIIVILGHNTINNLYTINNIENSINEVNIFQIPLEELVSSDLFGDSFELKDKDVYDAVLYVSKEYKVDSNVIKDVLSDTRLNKKAFKSLYSLVEKNYFELTNTSELVDKIITEHEFKNSVTLPTKLKSQLSTIMISYVRLLSDMTFNRDEKSKENFFICYSIIIAALVLTASVLVVSLVTKDKVLALKKVGLFGSIIAALMLIYSIIQEAMFVVMQYKFAAYSYAVDGLGTVLFKSIFIHSLLLLFVGLILMLFAKDLMSLDKDIKLGNLKKERKRKIKKKKIKEKKKKNIKKKEQKKKEKLKEEKTKVKKEKIKKERKKIDFSKAKEKLSKVNNSYLDVGSLFKKKNKDKEKEQ